MIQKKEKSQSGLSSYFFLTRLKEGFLGVFLAALSGFLSALVVGAFLVSLNLVTEFRILNPKMIFFLPFAGLVIVFLYSRVDSRLSKGTSLILEEIHKPQNVLPFKMAPLIFVSTLISHLCGASVGREGVAVQMSTALSDQLSKLFCLNKTHRQKILIAGMSGGFATALGAPWAGCLFGVEVIHGGKIKALVLIQSFIAAFVGYYSLRLLGINQTHFFISEVFSFDVRYLFWVTITGIVFGFVALFFSKIIHFFEKNLTLIFKNSYYQIFFTGLLLSFLFYFEGSGRYSGLGLSYIQAAFEAPSSFNEFLYKSFFTILSLSFGFKGGEFIPLVYMGTALGSAMSVVIPVSFRLLGIAGFAALFAGVSNAPLTCSVMAIEFFGWSVAPYVLAACYSSYLFSGQKGIYKNKGWSFFKKLKEFGQ